MTDGSRRQTRGADETRRTREAGESPEAAVYEEECELCGSRMYGLHCKLICSNCGYRRDCSDP